MVDSSYPSAWSEWVLLVQPVLPNLQQSFAAKLYHNDGISLDLGNEVGLVLHANLQGSMQNVVGDSNRVPDINSCSTLPKEKLEMEHVSMDVEHISPCRDVLKSVHLSTDIDSEPCQLTQVLWHFSGFLVFKNMRVVKAKFKEGQIEGDGESRAREQ